MSPYEVIIRPALSEKSNDLREVGNKYTFIVSNSAGKAEVKNAVESLWGVEVVKIATHIRRGKIKRRGSRLTTPKKMKRAIVSLKQGQKLPIFEDQ